MFSFFVASFITVQGVWMLPVKDYSVDLTIMQKNEKLLAVLSINSNCNKPSNIILKGRVSKKSCGTSIELQSKFIKLDDNCEIMATVLACGDLSFKTFKTNAFIISKKVCKNKSPETYTDKITGIWVKKSNKETKT